MEKKVISFFARSVAIVIVVCLAVFLWLTIFMSRKTESSIQEISNLYMAEMNRQIQQKFGSIIDLRLEQVEGIIKRTPQNLAKYGEDMLDELRTSSEIRNFSHLSLARQRAPSGEKFQAAPVLCPKFLNGPLKGTCFYTGNLI